MCQCATPHVELSDTSRCRLRLVGTVHPLARLPSSNSFASPIRQIRKSFPVDSGKRLLYYGKKREKITPDCSCRGCWPWMEDWIKWWSDWTSTAAVTRIWVTLKCYYPTDVFQVGSAINHWRWFKKKRDGKCYNTWFYIYMKTGWIFLVVKLWRQVGHCLVEAITCVMQGSQNRCPQVVENMFCCFSFLIWCRLSKQIGHLMLFGGLGPASDTGAAFSACVDVFSSTWSKDNDELLGSLFCRLELKSPFPIPREVSKTLFKKENKRVIVWILLWMPCLPLLDLGNGLVGVEPSVMGKVIVAARFSGFISSSTTNTSSSNSQVRSTCKGPLKTEPLGADVGVMAKSTSGTLVRWLTRDILPLFALLLEFNKIYINYNCMHTSRDF